MEEKITTSKIIVEESNELTDLVREIHKNKADRIVLTFTEHTDILISPINLKVLSETAQRENKLLIAQIIQNPTGIRNANLAGIKTIETPSNPTEYEWEEAEELVLINKKEKLEKRKVLQKTAITDDSKESFEEKIEEEFEKSPQKDVSKLEEIKSSNTESPALKGYVDKRGVRGRSSFVSIDQDIPDNEGLINDQVGQNTKTPIITKRFNLKSNILSKGGSFNKKKILKIFLFIFIPLILLGALGGFLYNQFGTFVKIKIFVESKTVEVESILTGDKEIDEIDFEKMKIPIKTEEKTKSLSDTITATGKKYDGEEATGKINIFYIGDCLEDTQPINLLSGHSVTSSYGKVYKLESDVTLSCDSDTSTIAFNIPIVASSYGTEYNFSSINVDFTIQGYPSGDLFGKNTTAIAGGTKEEYTVLSQVDINNGVEALSTTAIEEVKTELRDVSGDWEIIEDSILSSVDKNSIKTDIKVGEEATDVNLDITIKGTATYFKTDGLTDKLKTLLSTKAEEENLFDSEKDLELELSEDITKSVSVEEVKKDSVKIKIVASANIKPKINKQELVDALMGLGWDEGKNYLNSLRYAEKNPEATFNPMNYPAFLKRFPTREGGIIIEIKEIEVEEDKD